MEPIYRKAYIELDRPEERLKFYTIEAEKLTARGREGLPVTDACKPLFVVYKVRGAGRAGSSQCPPRQLSSARLGPLWAGSSLCPRTAPPSSGLTHIPLPLSCPSRLSPAQNGKAISKVQGALAPELETAVFDNVPEAPKDSEE